MVWFTDHYDLLRGLHISAVIAWMAGLLYLPRLFAYHSKATPGSEMSDTFLVMEARLLRIIMTPAMTAAYLFGFGLILADTQRHVEGWGFLLLPWMEFKLAGVAFLTFWHVYLAISQRRFAENRNPRSDRFWRIANEAPFIVAIIMVIAVTTECTAGRP
jgi:putative membrane protein